MKRLLLAGDCVSAHGIRGELKVKLFVDPETMTSLKRVYLGINEDEAVQYKVSFVRPHKGMILLSLQGVDSMTRAEQLVGYHAFAAAEDLGKLPDGEYYGFEILGLRVQTEDGRYLGSIEDIFATGSNDVYVVKDEGREYLIPAIAEVVKEIDLKGGRMVITPVEGLLGEE